MHERLARWTLTALLVVMVSAASFIPWTSVWSVDNRTYVEMVDGVRKYGLPYQYNGDFERFPELRAAFNVPSQGKLWGQYPPVYPYVASLALRLDGVRGLYRLNALLIGALLVFVYTLAQQFLQNPLASIAASVIVVFASPVWAGSFETFAQPLMLVLITAATWCALRSVDSVGRASAAWAVTAGFAGGLAAMTHLLALPMAITLFVVLGLSNEKSPEGDEGILARIRGLRPKRVDIVRVSLSVTAFGLVLVPAAFLNHVRFGTYNPASYGPCVWKQCAFTVQTALSTGSLASFAAPVAIWSGALVLALFAAWRRPFAVAAVCVAAIASLVLLPALRERAFGMVRTLYAYFVDVGPVDFVKNIEFPFYVKPLDGLGVLAREKTIKSLFQCSPVLALALLCSVPSDGPRTRVVASPLFGLLASLAILGRFSGPHALGWPYLFMRYAIPAVPFLAVLAVAAAHRLPWQKGHLVVALFVGSIGFAFFAQRMADSQLLRRIVELRVTLILAAITLAFVALWRRRGSVFARPAAMAVSILMGTSMAVSLGVDSAMSIDDSNDFEVRVRRFRALTPQRLAIVGWGPDTDPLLTLRAERDIEYVDLVEASNLENLRAILGRWKEEHRPVFAALPRSPNHPWPLKDVAATLVDAHENFWRIDGPIGTEEPSLTGE